MEHKKEDVRFFPRVWLYARTGDVDIVAVTRLLNEGRLLEQFFWTVSKVGLRFILKALLFKGFAVISYS